MFRPFRPCLSFKIIHKNRVKCSYQTVKLLKFPFYFCCYLCFYFISAKSIPIPVLESLVKFLKDKLAAEERKNRITRRRFDRLTQKIKEEAQKNGGTLEFSDIERLMDAEVQKVLEKRRQRRMRQQNVEREQ